MRSQEVPIMSSKPTEAVPGPIDHAVCALYKPGHQVHFIQAKLGWEQDPANLPHRHPDLRAGRRLDHGRRRRRGAALLEPRTREGARVLRGVGRACRAPRPLPASRSEQQTGNHCVCVSTDGPTPCAGPPPAGASPTERIKSHGGFFLSGPEIRRLLQDVSDEERRRGRERPSGGLLAARMRSFTFRTPRP